MKFVCILTPQGPAYFPSSQRSSSDNTLKSPFFSNEHFYGKISPHSNDASNFTAAPLGESESKWTAQPKKRVHPDQLDYKCLELDPEATVFSIEEKKSKYLKLTSI